MQPTFTVDYTPERSRLKTFFRPFLAIPHTIAMQVWMYLVNVLTFFQWWIILFTGKRNASIANMQKNWLGYAARVMSYSTSMYDEWPAFGPEKGAEPTTYEFAPEESANRLTNFFRMFTAIPALVVAMFVLIGAWVMMIGSWFAIMITGRQPKGIFDYLLKTHRYFVKLYSYTLLMTDTYPKFGA